MTTQRPQGRSTITPLRSKDNFIVACARLKRAAPQSFAEFEVAFTAVMADTMVRCVQSPGNEIFSNQGRAQFATELRDWFQDCIATADNLEAKLKERK